MNHLIDTLLEFSLVKDYPLVRGTVNLTEIAREVAAHLKQTQPDRAVTFLIGEGLHADADSRLMRILLDNLLGNAWKYTSRKAGAIIEFGEVSIEGGKVYFIRDNGVGFSQDNASELFGPFLRLHNEYDGSGIGLATVKRIVDRHEGTIWAEGKIGSGAIFYFRLQEPEKTA